MRVDYYSNNQQLLQQTVQTKQSLYKVNLVLIHRQSIDISQQVISVCRNKVSAYNNMKLSQIVIHHHDNQTDRLYEPLRKAITSYPPQMQLNQVTHHHTLHSNIRKSCMDFNKVQPNIFKETTLIPQNMRLIETNNPLKRFKARSRSYRAISVQQKVGSPLKSLDIKERIGPKIVSKKEIVYDYQPGEYYMKMEKQNIMVTTNQSGEYRLPARTRSVTLVPGWQTLAERVERVESKTAIIQTKQSQQLSNPSTKASIQIQEQQSMTNTQNKKRQSKQLKNIQEFSDYYQDCKRYTFDKKIKKQNEQSTFRSGLQLSPRSSNYKYNLFSMMDQQANTNCTSALCSKNEVISPRIKQRW